MPSRGHLLRKSATKRRSGFFPALRRAPRAIVFGCNDRCDQEHLLAQLAGGVRALTVPVDNLLSNGAYMLMTSLPWTRKAWAALLLPVEPRRRAAPPTSRNVASGCGWNSKRL